MFKVDMKINSIDLRRPAVKKAMREAQDKALVFHRNQYLKLHFLATHARLRYGDAYSKRGKTRSTHKRGVEKRRRPNAGRKNKDRKNKIPLFRSGLLKQKVLFGGVKITGRFDRRKIKYNPPFYLFISGPGQINKLDAISATTKSEQTKVTEFAGNEFMKILEQNQITLRSN